MDVAFDVKLTSNTSIKKNLLGSGNATKFSNEISPLQTRVIESHGKAKGFDMKYLDPHPNQGNLTVNEIAEKQANS